MSHNFWRRQLRADPAIVGKTIRLNRHDLTVVGVAPPEFHGTVPALVFDLWVPITMSPQLFLQAESLLRERGDRNALALVRLKPGVSPGQARGEAATVAASLAAAYPKSNRGIGATILPVWEQHDGPAELMLRPLRILMAISIVVLLIVCANVTNLLLARSVARHREFGIRLALGAARTRIARQLFTETLLLSSAGCLIAVPMLFWMQQSLPALVPSVGLPITTGYAYNGRIFAFTMLACLAAALASGAAPALFSLRTNVNESLKDSSRSVSPAASPAVRAPCW